MAPPVMRLSFYPVDHRVPRGAANPYDPQDASYFAKRYARRGNQPPATPPPWLPL